ncbi:hypothetical protein GCM10011411_09260 [Aurantiacibacter arachoides]|nr:hypothetical protein GCM10011411_09260 [Aurantiacibacter arachoides]
MAIVVHHQLVGHALRLEPRSGGAKRAQAYRHTHQPRRIEAYRGKCGRGDRHRKAGAADNRRGARRQQASATAHEEVAPIDARAAHSVGRKSGTDRYRSPVS